MNVTLCPFGRYHGTLLDFCSWSAKKSKPFFFFFSEKSSAGQLGSLQFLKEHSLEIEYYQKSVNVRENIASQYSNGIHTSKTAATLIAM